MEDTCICCYERLANITPTCGHRLYCNLCFERMQEEGRQNCPYCRNNIVSVRDTSHMQLRATTLSDAIIESDCIRDDYPFGYMLVGTSEEIADKDMYTAVQQAMEAVQANRLGIKELKKALRRRLTMDQYQLVFVKFIEDQNLHDVLKKLDSRKFEKREYMRNVQELVEHTVESTDTRAIIARAGVTTLGGAAVDGLLSVGSNGVSAFGGLNIGNAVSNIAMFTIFTAVELYRWSKGLDGREVAKNIGEHFVGSCGGFAAGYGGFMGGAAAGAALGSVIPGLGTAIGGAVGGVIGSLIAGLMGDALCRYLYRKVLPGKTEELHEREISEQHQMSPKEVVDKAATKFGINVDVVPFADAQQIFRSKLLITHPDKNPDVSPEERERLTDETRDILACWLIVREYYNDRGEIEESDCEEGFVKAFALKVYDAVSNQWYTARMFFKNLSLGRDINPEIEKIEEVTIYV